LHGIKANEKKNTESLLTTPAVNSVQLGQGEDMEVEEGGNMESLLDRYKSIFAEPKELPHPPPPQHPPRSHDHRIILQHGTVCVKPYKYPFHQKTEIEKQVEDMLERGVIRPSNSPYSSPVLLVKKGDET
jgi:hypothetical protein